MRILLTEGSGLTSRQVAARLSQLGHEVEILSSAPICLTRFTRHVLAVHPVPPFGLAPLEWLETAVRVAQERHIDLIFPTQEQVAILSARQDDLPVSTIVPPFEAFRRVLDKVSAHRTLQELGLPEPETHVVSEHPGYDYSFPVFLKRAVGTASSGVWRVETRQELQQAVASSNSGPDQLIVQQAMDGPLAMVQAVASHGKLLAYHACLRVREGVGGGACLKESVSIPGLPDLLSRLVEALLWHGGISLDLILSSDGPVIIDINPRLVEPGNALRSGVDLAGHMLAAAAGTDGLKERPISQEGVRTRQSLIGILGAAARTEKRRDVLAETWDALMAKGPYAGSAEELTPLPGDWKTAIPVLVAIIATMIYPPLWKKFHSGAVGPYALTPQAWQIIQAEWERALNSARDTK